MSLAAHRNAYRISRSNNNRKKKESYDYNFDYDTGSQSGHDIGHEISGHEDAYATEHIGKSGYSEGSGKCFLDDNCWWEGIRCCEYFHGPKAKLYRGSTLNFQSDLDGKIDTKRVIRSFFIWKIN